MILRIREKTLDFSNRTMVMGIININDDSFSGDGTLDQYKAMQMALEKVDQGPTSLTLVQRAREQTEDQ